MPYAFEIFSSFDDFPMADKSSLSERPICRGIDAIERSGIDNLENYYVITSENNQVVCISYFQLLHVKPLHFNLGDRKFQQLALSLALRLVKPTLLVAGNLFRHDVEFQQYTDHALPGKDKAAIFSATTEYMISKTNASGIFLKDVPTDIAVYIQQDHTYTQMQDDISMEMDIPPDWASYKDYEKALKHKYLQRSKKIRKAFQDISIREFDLQDIEQYSYEMGALYHQVTHHQLVSMGILKHHFFIELKRILQEDYKVCGYFHGDKLVAFSSAIIHDHEYDMNYIGFDYHYNQTHHLYFNILFHCLENAMHFGCHKLILGRTAPEAKAIMGCQPDYRFSFYKLRNVIVNWFYRMVASYFREQQGDGWKGRHPFKSSFYIREAEAIEK